MKKVAVATTFADLNPQYSLTSIVKDQLEMLVKFGYETKFIAMEGLKQQDSLPKGVELLDVIPRHHWFDYQLGTAIKPEFPDQVQDIAAVLMKSLDDVDICITHDLMFQTWFLPHNEAVRLVGEKLPGLKWLHWVHSGPSARPNEKLLVYPHTLRYSTMPKSKYIYLNDTDALRYAEMIGGNLDDIRVVYNPINPEKYFHWHPLTKELIDKYAILSADVIQIYPFSMPRAGAKQLDKVIHIFAKLKELGKSVKLIICDAHSNADREKEEKKKYLNEAQILGLTPNEVIFTSLFKGGGILERGVPGEVVSDLFKISNLFIFPSISEACSLILLEASLGGNLLVLNDDFAPMRDFGGKDALYFKFSSATNKTEYANKDKYMSDVAKIIVGELSKNRPMNQVQKMRQLFTPEAIFRRQVEPLLYEEF